MTAQNNNTEAPNEAPNEAPTATLGCHPCSLWDAGRAASLSLQELALQLMDATPAERLQIVDTLEG